MNLDSFTGPGSTPSRRRFWDKVTQAIIASQKVAGKNVSVDEYQSYGSVISINPQRQGTAATTGACCNEGVCTQTTEGDCAGIFKGVGTPCDPNPCCSNCGGVVWEGCTDGDGNCRTGPENCDGCAGEIVPCDKAVNGLWYTDIEYCLSCPGGELVECCRTSINPITCEEISTCPGSCGDCEGGGSTHQMADYFPPCPELSPPP